MTSLEPRLTFHCPRPRALAEKETEVKAREPEVKALDKVLNRETQNNLNHSEERQSEPISNMPLAIPPELKKITPFIKRAEELDRDKSNPESRLVAYYCRQFAVHTGIPLSSTSPAAKTCLGHILGDLEKEKAAMDNFTRDEASFLCRKFANGVFDKADEEDRNGATKNTAKAFYAAASFLQILEQFEPEEGSEQNEEDRKRIMYAKWKATDILKAFKEGRTPTPGGYGETEMNLEDGDAEEGETEKEQEKPPVVETVTDEEEEGKDVVGFDMPVAPLPPPQPVVPPAPAAGEEPSDEENDKDGKSEGQEVELGPPPAYPGSASAPSNLHVDKPKLTFDLPPPVDMAPVPAPEPKKSGGIFGFGKKKGGKASKAQLADASELTRFALAALEDKDADLAANRLQQALAALGR